MTDIFSNKITKGPRTYYFDIKENERGNYFMTITESKKVGDNVERRRILVFEEDMVDFVEAFHNTLEGLQKISKIYK